jgi:outer membrane protein
MIFARVRLMLMICVLGACLAFVSHDARAQQDQTRMVRFGVVDVEDLERDAIMNKDMNAQMNELRKKLSEEVKQEEAELRKASDELQRQKVLLAPDAFDQEVRKFRQRELAFQKKIQDRNNDFNRVRIYARNAFAKELNRSLAEITKEHEFTLILRRSQTLVVADFLDITKVVLDRINKNMPKFTIPKDVIQPAASGAPKAGAPKGAEKKSAAPAKK